MQLVDERCAARCQLLADSLCERTSTAPTAECELHLKRWRDFCVTNSACNPAGRQQDPGRAEKRCAALAKRVAICGASVDGQARPSGTAGCEEQRRRWQALCDGVRVRGDIGVGAGVDAHDRSKAITQAYREAAAREAPQSRVPSGSFIESAADLLGAGDTVGLGRIVGDHPVKAILTL